MSDASITSMSMFKWFWPDQVAEQERWLRTKAGEGWHLKSTSWLGRWTFVKGEPADMFYRIDYIQKAYSADQRQLFEDAGWERAAQATGWQYWRKAASGAGEHHIYTDNVSSAGKLERMLGMFALCIMPLTVTLLTSDKELLRTQLSLPTQILIGTVVVIAIPVYAYIAVRLMRSIRRLKRQSAQA